MATPELEPCTHGANHSGFAFKVDGHKTSWARLFCSVLGAQNDRRTRSALAEYQGTLGGYIVPEKLASDLMASVAESSVFYNSAFKVPMTTARVRMPLPSVRETASAGTSPFFGGLRMDWVSESGSVSQREPAFRMVTLNANTLAAQLRISNTMLDDVPFFDAWIRNLIATAIAWHIDYYALRGTGVSQMLGVLNSPGSVSVSRNTGSDVKAVDCQTMIGKLLPGWYGKAVWFCHPDCLPKITALASSLSTSYVANMPSTKDAPCGYLMSRPLVPTEKLPALGTAGDLVLAVPELYVIGQRSVEVTLSRDVPSLFEANQSAWLVVVRLDGQPWFDSAITIADGAKTVSPFVYLT